MRRGLNTQVVQKWEYISDEYPQVHVVTQENNISIGAWSGLS